MIDDKLNNKKILKEYSIPKLDNFTPMAITYRIKRDFLDEFVAFIQKYGVIGLIIGVVMGTAVNTLVGSFVSNILTPVISKILEFALKGVQLKDLAWEGIRYGAFIDELIKFVLIAIVVFLIIRYVVVYFLNDEEKEKFNVMKKLDPSLSVENMDFIPVKVAK